MILTLCNTRKAQRQQEDEGAENCRSGRRMTLNPIFRYNQKSRVEQKAMPIKGSDHWIVQTSERSARFLTLFSLVLLGLFLLGNFQDFAADNLRYLLRALEFCCLIGALISIYILVYYIIHSIIKKTAFLGKIVVVVISAIYNAGIYLAIKFLGAWLQTI